MERPRLGLSAALGGTLLVLAGVFCQSVSAADPKPLKWGADAEGGAPYIFLPGKDTEQVEGFEVEIVAALAKELGRPIEFHQYEFGSLLPGLDRGDIDLAMNGLEVTPDRKTEVRFTRPYYVYQLQVVVRADERRFSSLAQLKAMPGHVVGTLNDTAASRLLTARGINRKEYNGQLEPFDLLERGQLDAVLIDLPIAVYYGQHNQQLKFLGEPFAEGTYAIALRKQDEALAVELDGALDRLIKNGTLCQIYRKWKIWNEQQEKPDDYRPSPQDDGDDSAPNVVAETAANQTFGVYFKALCGAAVVTVWISVLSMTLAMGIGLVVAIARLYGPVPVRGLALCYVEFFRGVPILLLLWFLYYGLPQLMQGYLGIPFSPNDYTVAILAFGLNYAAYEAEIYRAGISSIPAGQWEAAASLGMKPLQTFRRIIFPQALRAIIPPVTNDFVALFKDTSVVSVIAIVELTKQYLSLAKSSHKYLEIGAMTVVLYLVMSVPLGYLARYLEKRWGKGLA